ncbi:MAG: hypothetical protein V1921_02645 [Candidatus Altiarchaeota archaeon]
MKFYVRYNAQEGKFTEKVKDHFDGYVIDSPNLEYYNNAFSQILLKTGKSFVVDPHLYDLVSDKRSHARYVSKLDVEDEIRQIPSDKKRRKDFVRKFLTFQENRINEALSEDPLDEVTKTVDPEFLIAPYGFIDEENCPAQQHNLNFIKDAKELYPKKKVYAGLALTIDLLINKRAAAQICNAYAKSDADGFCFSAIEFDVYSASTEYLSGYKDILNGLSQTGKPIISTYSSFFDLLLPNVNIHAIVHGADSGDRLRRASPGFGQRQYSRFYVPGLKNRFSGSELDYIKKNAPELMKCDCGYCNNQDEREAQINHYLAARSKEVKEYNKKADLIGDLKQVLVKNKKLQQVIKIDYLDRWIKVAENK